MRVGIYHGGDIQCVYHNVQHAIMTEGCATWDANLIFELQLADIPRMARICFMLYATIDKRIKKGGTIGKAVRDGKQVTTYFNKR